MSKYNVLHVCLGAFKIWKKDPSNWEDLSNFDSKKLKCIEEWVNLEVSLEVTLENHGDEGIAQMLEIQIEMMNKS